MRDHLEGGLIAITILCIALAVFAAVTGIWFWAFNIETTYNTGRIFIASLVTAFIALLICGVVFKDDEVPPMSRR